jgi:hypothetical protein
MDVGGDFMDGSVHNFVGVTVEQRSPVYTTDSTILSPHQPPKNGKYKEDILCSSSLLYKVLYRIFVMQFQDTVF